MPRGLFILFFWFALATAFAKAQEPAHVHDAAAARSPWQWGAESNAFFGYNYQRREFTDFG